MLQQHSCHECVMRTILQRSVDSNINERKTKGLTNLNSDEKSLDKLVCPWPECIFRSLLQFLVLWLPENECLTPINTLRPRQDGRHFPDDIFKCIFLNENVWIPIKISLKFVPKVPINDIPALVQIMAWRRKGDKPLYETMMVSLLTHICVTRPQWVNS